VRDLFDRIGETEARFEAWEPSIQAFLPEEGRFDRLRRDARTLVDRYPDPARRPPLFGRLVGVKDIFHADGYDTRAGSRLPPAALRGAEGDCVARLKRAGALILGKTVTTEFAYFTPGPTRNPRNTAHTPGGSSSGSAAAVAAGVCDVALGTQTIGSIVRPAAFCGIVGLKPTFDRLPTTGVIPVSPSLDHVGLLAPTIDDAIDAARVLSIEWRGQPARLERPVMGVPEGPYLGRASSEALDAFTTACRVLSEAGYELRRVPIMPDYDSIYERHHVIMAAEAARIHAAWFDEYEALYSRKMADLIRRGRAITGEQLQSALAARDTFRVQLRHAMRDSRIDAWIAPSATGPAPSGLASTGDPVMNLPWTQAGFPAVNLPAGRNPDGLPFGLQMIGDWNADESVLGWARGMEPLMRQL
jgi:Asp-tRNA(Asn)/Glu-tRNA(Gln) amidotransferase A subunit family amidase